MRTKQESLRRLERYSRRLTSRWMRLRRPRSERRLRTRIQRLEIFINKLCEA